MQVEYVSQISPTAFQGSPDDNIAQGSAQGPHQLASRNAPRFATVSTGETMALVEQLFKEVITPLYGDQTDALRKIKEGTDRKCKLLYHLDQPVGVIVYKTALSNEYEAYGIKNSLELKTLFVIDAKNNSGKGIGKQLVDKVIKIARKLHASSIHVTVNEKVEESTVFFKKNRFVILASLTNGNDSSREDLFKYSLV
jgi:GNAT superfamily N-acetyltransferase